MRKIKRGSGGGLRLFAALQRLIEIDEETAAKLKDEKPRLSKMYREDALRLRVLMASYFPRSTIQKYRGLLR